MLVQKEAKHARGVPRALRRLAALDTDIVFLLVAEKQIRTARRCAPKVACGGIFIARALEREGRTTTPLPSSKEGNYGSSGLILLGQVPPIPQVFAAVFCFCLPPVCTPPPTPTPKGRGGYLRPKSPTISQTRKLFMKVCANSTLSLQISLVSSVLVRGLLFTGK